MFLTLAVLMRLRSPAKTYLQKKSTTYYVGAMQGSPAKFVSYGSLHTLFQEDYRDPGVNSSIR